GCELETEFDAASAKYGFSFVAQILSGKSNDRGLIYRAEDELRQALRDDPQSGHAHGFRALTHLYQGRKQLVPEEVDQAVRDNPKDMPAQTFLVIYHMLNGDYDHASQLSKHLIERFPLYWPARLDLGEVIRQQEDVRSAMDQQKRVLEQDLQNVSALVYLARAYVDSDDLRKARETLERARAEDRPNYQLRVEWAILLAREGKKEEALREMDKDVQAFAEIDPLWTERVSAFYSVMGESDAALQWLDK